METDRTDQILGCVIGTAVGDALGLPYEGVSPARAKKLFGPPDRHRFVVGHGMVSDDTEHTCMTAQALITAQGDVEVFRSRLARSFRWWLLGLPAGLGSATLRGIVKLWFGVHPLRSGVFSAGNGPAMRSPLLGVVFADDPPRMRAFVEASSRLTHSDPLAEHGALAVAIAAAVAISEPDLDSLTERFMSELREAFRDGEDAEILGLCEEVSTSVAKGESTRDFANKMGLEKGVTGFVNHTVPICIHAWLTHPEDFRSGVTETILCGGDADTTAAIVGALIGARVGSTGIPIEWVSGIAEWPRGIQWMHDLSHRLSASLTDPAIQPIPAKAIFILPRNLFFLCVVLFHGFRRLFP